MNLRLINRILQSLFTRKNRTTHTPGQVQRKAALAGFLLPIMIYVTLVSVSQRQAFGQTNLASITGTVTDNTGAALPNVNVSILNTDTTAVRVVTTDANGFYTAPSLNAGSYRITATAAGFDKAAISATLT